MLRMIAVALLLVSLPSLAQEHSVVWENGVYPKTVSKWTSALSKTSDIDSTTYIRKQLHGEDRLHSAGHRDVIYWIPKSTNLSEPFVMLIWFHGHYGYVEERTFISRTLGQIVPKVDEANFVLVLPEMPWSVHGKTPTKRNSLIWTKKGQFLEFIDVAHSVLYNHNGEKDLGRVEYRVVGHSAGGSTIKRLAITGDLCKLGPSMVVWSDSSYGRWLDDAWNGCLSKSKTLVDVYVHIGGKPHKNLKRFLRFFNKKNLPENLNFSMMGKGWSHKKIGDGIVDLSGVLDMEEYRCQQ